MKKFTKWLNKQIPEHGDYKIIAAEDKIAEKAWKAALEKVLKHTKRTNRGRVGIIDWIEEELKN